MSKAKEQPEPCKPFCLCVLCKVRNAEERRMWSAALAELPEATASLLFYDGKMHEAKG